MITDSAVTNDLYAEFSAEVRQELATHEQVVSAPRGATLLLSGTCPDQVIILNSGSAETSVPASGTSLSLGIGGAGKVFGLHSIMSGVPTDTSVTCLEQCEVTLLPKKAFLDALERHPQMYMAVVKVLSADLAAADRVIRNYARGSAARNQIKHVKPG
jgi:CRP-like cAMP-binding protein